MPSGKGGRLIPSGTDLPGNLDPRTRCRRSAGVISNATKRMAASAHGFHSLATLRTHRVSNPDSVWGQSINSQLFDVETLPISSLATPDSYLISRPQSGSDLAEVLRRFIEGQVNGPLAHGPHNYVPSGQAPAGLHDLHLDGSRGIPSERPIVHPDVIVGTLVGLKHHPTPRTLPPKSGHRGWQLRRVPSTDAIQNRARRMRCQRHMIRWAVDVVEGGRESRVHVED
jgi:hypothetical protein